PVGVVLDRGHAGGHTVLAPLEVDLAVQALGAAAAVARGLAPVRVAAARLREALDEGLLRPALGDLREVRVGDEAPARRGGLGLADGHQRSASRPWKIGIVSPWRTCTMAFFHSRVRPAVTPRRLGLEGTFDVRTSSTLTSSN